MRTSVSKEIDNAEVQTSSPEASSSRLDRILARADKNRNAALEKAQQEQVARKQRIAALENEDDPEEELEDLRDLLR